MRRPIETPNAPLPNGHYSQGVEHDGLIFLSMQLPLIPGGPRMPDGVEAQTGQVIENCRAILKAAGSDVGDVLNVTIYLADVADWSAVNEVFERAFACHRPARGMVSVPALHLNARVAMQMVAAKRQSRRSPF